MRRVIGFLGSLGVGVLLTAAGLVLDARVLIYSGIAIFALMLALSLWAWARPLEVQPSAMLAEPTYPPDTTDDQRAIIGLAAVRENAIRAKKQWGTESAENAYREFEAVQLSLKRQFGITPLGLYGNGRVEHKLLLDGLVAYADVVLPLLRQGHIAEARDKAAGFWFSWGDGEGWAVKLMAPRPPKA